MVGCGFVVFFTVFISCVYIKNLEALVKKGNRELESREVRRGQFIGHTDGSVEIYEAAHENVRVNTDARSTTRTGRRTINNEVYEMVQQRESSENRPTERITHDDDNRTYQTVSAELPNDDHIYKELSSGQC